MAAETDFYIAWDGRRYAGAPPPGWYLAADNRWWPSRDLQGNDAGSGEDTLTVDGWQEPQPDPVDQAGQPSRPAPTTEQRPQAPDSWAPESGRWPGDSGPTETQTWPPPPTGPTNQQSGGPQPSGRPDRRRSSGRRRGRFRVGPGIFILAFLLFRCGAGLVDGDGVATESPFPTAPTTAVPTTGLPSTTGPATTPTTTTLTTTTAQAAGEGLSNGPTEANVVDCGPTVVAGEVTNTADFPLAVEVVIVASSEQDSYTLTTDAVVPAGATAPWLILVPSDLDPPTSCEVVDLTSEPA